MRPRRKVPVEVKDGIVDVRITTKKAYCSNKSFGQTEEWVQSYSVEQTVDAPAPQIKEEIIEVVKQILQDKVQNHTVVPVLQIRTETGEVTQPMPREQERVVEETTDVPIPQMMEESIEVVKHIPQEQVQSYTAEQLVTMPVPRIWEETGQVIQLIQQRRIPNRVVEHIVDVLVPKIRDQIVEVVKVITQERLQRHTREQIAHVPVFTQAEVPAVQVAQKTVEVPDGVADTPVAVQHQVPMVPQLQSIDEAAQQERQQHRSQQQQTVQGEKQEEEGRKVEKRKREEQEEEEQEGGGKRESQSRNGMDAAIQIFVKADGTKTVSMEVSPKAKVLDVARRTLRTRSERSQDVYVTSDGVRDGSTVQIVRRLRGGGRNKGKMLGGGKKKTPKKAEHSDQSTTEKSSSEVDAAFEMFERCSRTGIGGWSAKMTKAMLGMDDEQTEEMLMRLRSGFQEEVGNDPEPMIEGIRRFLQERRRRGRSARGGSERDGIAAATEASRGGKRGRAGAGQENAFREGGIVRGDASAEY